MSANGDQQAAPS